MSWSDAFKDLGVTIASREQLLAVGASSRSLTSAVRGGHLLRVRRDHYGQPPLLQRVDGRAEAGQETILRLLFEDAGLHCDIQIIFAGIGRVDIVVEDLVVVEADSRLAHDGWELHVRDRNRDIDLAALGLPSLRPAYQRTMHAPQDVLAAVLGLLAANGHFRVHL